MYQSNSLRVLVFDGISNVALGKQIYKALQSFGISTEYLNPHAIKRKRFYRIRRTSNKIFQKQKRFFYYPVAPLSSIKEQIKSYKPNVIFVIGFYYKFLNKQQMLNLQKEFGFDIWLYDTDSGNMFYNNKMLEHFLENDVSASNRIFSFSKIITLFLQRLGHKEATILPFGSPILPAKESTIKQQTDILFVGLCTTRRIFLLEKLANHNIKIVGKKWDYHKNILSQTLREKLYTKDIYNDELYDVIHNSKIILNINSAQWHGIETGVNLRITETLALGGFLLTEYSQELAELFNIGEELETFQSSEELVDKINYYLKHDKERQRIAQKGHERFLKDYTWESILKNSLSSTIEFSQ